MSFTRKIINPLLAGALDSWRKLDQSKESQEDVEEMVENLPEEQLEKMFLVRLAFGTAGLRGVMEPGYGSINDVTIQQTSQGYCAYILDRFGSTDAKDRGVFIGFDGRHNSENFAHLTAAVFLSKGVRVRLSKDMIATPIVAYAVLKLSCLGGIVITASHNPKEYNGYKIYSETGSQILTPVDSDISAWINQSLTLWREVEELFDRTTRRLSAAAENSPLLEKVFDSIVDLYVEDIAADLAAPPSAAGEGTEGTPGSLAAAAAEEAKKKKQQQRNEEGAGGKERGRKAERELAAAAADFAIASDFAAAAAAAAAEKGGDTAAAAQRVEGAAAAAEAAAAAGTKAAATAEYLATAERLSPEPDTTETKQLRVLYTALHGVGTPFVKRMLDAFQFNGEIFYSKEQCTPDPEFSSVGGSPNPEEKHALDVAIREADARRISLVIANDPDADRFAAAEKHEGRWVKFSGDELGVMLASYSMKLREMQGIPKENMAFVASAVSSRMLEKMVKKNGCFYAETLTGFKWMEAKALELCAAGYCVVLLYEEALGYALSNKVRDKDGISAAAVFLQCAASLREEGRTFQDMLQELRREYGCFCTRNSYLMCSSSSSIRRFFFFITHYHDPRERKHEEGKKKVTSAIAAEATAEERRERVLREREEEEEREEELEELVQSRPCHYPKSMGNFHIVRIRDVARQYDSQEENTTCSLPPTEELITFYFENGAVLTLRASGTEPKLKYYCETYASTFDQGEELLNQLIEAFFQSFIKAKKNLFLNVPE